MFPGNTYAAGLGNTLWEPVAQATVPNSKILNKYIRITLGAYTDTHTQNPVLIKEILIQKFYSGARNQSLDKSNTHLASNTISLKISRKQTSYMTPRIPQPIPRSTYGNLSSGPQNKLSVTGKPFFFLLTPEYLWTLITFSPLTNIIYPI